MKLKVLIAGLCSVVSAHCFAHFTFVPQAIESVLPKNQSVVSITYGRYSQEASSDAVVISIDQQNEPLIEDKFANLYKFQRYIYVLRQTRGQWTLISQNTTLLRARELSNKFDTSDYIRFSNHYIDGDLSTAYISISPIGLDPNSNEARATYSLSYSTQDQKSYVTNEDYQYVDPSKRNHACTTGSTFAPQQIEFSTFQPNQKKLVSAALRNKKCGN